MKTRWTSSRWNRCRGAVMGMITQMIAEKWSRARLVEKKLELFRTLDYKLLPSMWKSELKGMLSGAEHALMAAHVIVWAHEVSGSVFEDAACFKKMIPSAKFAQLNLPYDQIDPERSAFIWAGTQIRWM